MIWEECRKYEIFSKIASVEDLIDLEKISEQSFFKQKKYYIRPQGINKKNNIMDTPILMQIITIAITTFVSAISGLGIYIYRERGFKINLTRDVQDNTQNIKENKESIKDLYNLLNQKFDNLNFKMDNFNNNLHKIEKDIAVLNTKRN